MLDEYNKTKAITRSPNISPGADLLHVEQFMTMDCLPGVLSSFLTVEYLH